MSQTLKEESNLPGKVRDEEHLRQRKELDPEREDVRLQGKSREPRLIYRSWSSMRGKGKERR